MEDDLIDMMDCGHSEGFWRTIMGRVVGNYSMNLENHNTGARNMFRSKQKRETYIKYIGGGKNQSDWFRKDGTTTTATVPTTPDGLLAKQMTFPGSLSVSSTRQM